MKKNFFTICAAFVFAIAFSLSSKTNELEQNVVFGDTITCCSEEGAICGGSGFPPINNFIRIASGSNCPQNPPNPSTSLKP